MKGIALLTMVFLPGTYIAVGAPLYSEFGAIVLNVTPDILHYANHGFYGGPTSSILKAHFLVILGSRTTSNHSCASSVCYFPGIY